jgi:hypothetical protein
MIIGPFDYCSEPPRSRREPARNSARLRERYSLLLGGADQTLKEAAPNELPLLVFYSRWSRLTDRVARRPAVPAAA